MEPDSTCADWLQQTFASNQYNDFVDATGRPGSGFLEGNTVWLGNYDQCQRLDGAKYCLVESPVTVPGHANLTSSTVNIRWGVCVSSQCSETQVTENLGVVSKDIFNLHGLVLGFSDSAAVHCVQSTLYDTGFYAIRALVCILVSLCLVRLITDLFPSCSAVLPQNFRRFLSCWSLRDNLSKLFQFSDRSEHERKSEHFARVIGLDCFRVINIGMIILGHTFLATFSSGLVANPKDLLAFAHTASWQPIGNAYFMVYTYMCIGGVLTSYTGFHLLKLTNGKLSLAQYFCHRYIRLVPTMAFLMAFWMYIKPHIANGPVWYGMQTDPACDTYWWTNLLFIQNLYPTSAEQACNGWTWYLAVDTQLHVVGVFLVMYMYRGTRKVWRLMLALLLGSILLTAFITLRFDVDVNLTGLVLRGDHSAMDKYESLVFGKSYCRLAPYLVGMATGYVLYDLQQQQHGKPGERRPLLLSKLAPWFLWPASMMSMAGCLWFWYVGAYMWGPEGPSRVTHAAYESLAPAVWAVSVAWILLACNTGNAGPLTSVLDWPGWRPFSRLTYSLYLVHPIVMFIFFFSLKTSIHVSSLTILMCYSLMVALSLPLSALVWLLVEQPFANLERWFITKHRVDDKSK